MICLLPFFIPLILSESSLSLSKASPNTAYNIDNRQSENTCKQINCSSFSMVQKESSYDTIYLIYHRNYTQTHLADTVKRATTIIGEALTQSSHTADYPLVTLQSSCLTVSTEFEGTFALRYINFVVNSSKFLTMSVNSAVSLFDLTFYGMKEGSQISEALISATAGRLTLDTVSCYNVKVTGSSLIKLSNLNTFTVENMLASSISTNQDGSVISVATGSASTSISITNSAFSSCTAKRNGGALCITVSNPLNTLTLNNVEFPECSASKGGGVYLTVTAAITKHTISLVYDDGLPTATKGAMLYVVTTSDDFQKDIQNLCMQLDIFAYTLRNSYVHLEKANDVFNMAELTVPYYVLYYGESDVECSSQYDRRCATIQNALSRRQSEGLKSSKLIILRQGTHNAEITYTPIHWNLYFTGETNTPTQTVVYLNPYTSYASFYISDPSDHVTYDENPTVYFQSIGFVVTSGTGFHGAFTVGASCSLNIVNCDFTLQQDAASLASSLITNSHKLSIYKSTFHGLTLAGSPLIYLDDTKAGVSAELLQSSFTSITRTSGNGAVIYDTSTNGIQHTLSILGCNFTRCFANYGYGGALAFSNPSLSVSISSAADASVHPEVTTTRTIFKECYASFGGAIYYVEAQISFGDVQFTSNTASEWGGSAIYANCQNNIYDLRDFATFKSPDASTGKYVAKIPSNPNPFDIFDHVPFRVWLSGEQRAYDTTDCGTVSACRTFSTLLDNLKTGGIYYHEISLDATTHDPESAYVILARDIYGQGIGRTIKIVASLGGDPCFYVGSDDSYESASISALTFRVLSCSGGAAFESSLFQVGNSQTLTLSRVAFDIAADATTYKISPLSNNAIDVDQGTLVLNGCSFKGFTLATHPLLYFNQNSPYIGYLECGAERTTFTNIVRTKGNGAVFDLTFQSPSTSSSSSSKTNGYGSQQYTFTITNMAFEGCVCENGNGGAIHATIAYQTCFEVSGVSFTNCQATTSSTTGSAVGGAIYLSMEGAPSFYSFSLSSLAYSGCSADYGDVFFGGSATEDLAYDYYFWSGMVTGDVPDNSFAVAPTEAGTGGSLKIDEKKVKQVKDIQPPQDKDSGLSGAIIAVIIIVVLLVVIAIVVVIIVCCCCRKKSSDSNSSSDSSSNKKEEPQEMSYPAAPATDYNNPLYNA